MPEKNRLVTINARKFDGRLHRQWQAELIEVSETLHTFVGVFDSEVVHSDLGIIRPGTVSYEYYWLDRWFNVFEFHEPEGSLRNFYCNINLPPKYVNDVLDYIDLDIDVLVWRDFTTEVLDRAEFEANALAYGYPDELMANVERALAELMSMISRRDFPFDKNATKTSYRRVRP